MRLRGTGATAATFKSLNVCVDQVACTWTRFTLVMRARCATVDVYLDIDLKSIFSGVVKGIGQVLSIKGGVQCMLAEHPTDHHHGPVEVANNKITGFH